ncbi:patatin-like phospholipase family protein [Chitinimonas sp.]|uniref:patatin-like phospholipase family protein n=1 Tax=Chitinimonas sp. TaxID=1934313 RepID=UPI0035B2E158
MNQNRQQMATSGSTGIALVLQGGGALGAYQAGVYEALSHSRYMPDWVAGVSIGAINAAIIAGNPPERRVARLQEFWHRVSSHLLASAPGDGHGRMYFNWASATLAATFGVPGFYRPRQSYELLGWPNAPRANSIYDTQPLRATLEELIDFDLINQRKVRLSVGAVEVESGNSVYFDNHAEEIRPEHIIASGALPPAFAPVEINGRHYWDGGIVSNTPLQYVLDHRADAPGLVLQVDLFNAHGPLPTDLGTTLVRHKDIMYSSRTRFNTDTIRQHANMQQAVGQLLAALPESLRNHPAARKLQAFHQPREISIVHLIYRPPDHHLDSKDYEFSRASVEERWAAGAHDVQLCIDHPDWLRRSASSDAVITYDLTNPVTDHAIVGANPHEN